MSSDAISEDLKKHDSIQIIEPRERSGSSDTITKTQQEICSTDDQILVAHQDKEGLSVHTGKSVAHDPHTGFSTKKEIEPEDNIEQDSSSQSDYDTELDTDEQHNNFNSSNNNSFENQEKMFDAPQKSNRVSGGIKCLRNFRVGVGRKARKQKGGLSSRKKKPKTVDTLAETPGSVIKTNM